MVYDVVGYVFFLRVGFWLGVWVRVYLRVGVILLVKRVIECSMCLCGVLIECIWKVILVVWVRVVLVVSDFVIFFGVFRWVLRVVISFLMLFLGMVWFC